MREAGSEQTTFRCHATRLLAHLEVLSIVNGRKEPGYPPALRSFLDQYTFSDWTTLLNIFGTSTSDSMERHRHASESIVIFIQDHSGTLGPELVQEIGEGTSKKILRSREAGEKSEIRFTYSGEKEIGLILLLNSIIKSNELSVSVVRKLASFLDI